MVDKWTESVKTIACWVGNNLDGDLIVLRNIFQEGIVKVILYREVNQKMQILSEAHFSGGKSQSNLVQESESENANSIVSAQPSILLDLGYLVEKYSQFICGPLSDEFYLVFRQGFNTSELFVFCDFFFNLLLITSKQCQVSIVFLSFLCHNCQNK